MRKFARGSARMVGAIVGGLACCASPVLAGGVVGTGSAASCTEAALDSALAGGGSVTFDCGPAPALLFVTSAKVITADTSIDGGGLIAIGKTESAARMFTVGSGVNLALANILAVGWRADPPGGPTSVADFYAVYNDDGTL